MEVAPPPRSHVALRQDVVVALGVAALLIVGSEFAVADDLWVDLPRVVGPLLPPPLVAVLLLTGSLVLILRRVAALPVLAVCVVCSLGVQALGRAVPLPVAVL